MNTHTSGGVAGRLASMMAATRLRRASDTTALRGSMAPVNTTGLLRFSSMNAMAGRGGRGREGCEVTLKRGRSLGGEQVRAGSAGGGGQKPALASVKPTSSGPGGNMQPARGWGASLKRT
jgi:hypothetical protein